MLLVSVVEAAARPCRQAPRPALFAPLRPLPCPLDPRVVVRRVRPRLLAALLRPVVGELRVGRAEPRGGLLAAGLLPAALVVELEPVEGAEGGGEGHVGAGVGLFEPALPVPRALLPVLLDPVLVGLALPPHVGHLLVREVAGGAWHGRGKKLGILVEEPPLGLLAALGVRLVVLVRLEVVLAYAGRLEELGVALDLVEVAILPELRVELVLGGLLAIERLVEAAPCGVVGCVCGGVQGGGRSFTFLRCCSRKEPLRVAARAQLASPARTFRSVIARCGSSQLRTGWYSTTFHGMLQPVWQLKMVRGSSPPSPAWPPSLMQQCSQNYLIQLGCNIQTQSREQRPLVGEARRVELAQKCAPRESLEHCLDALAVRLGCRAARVAQQHRLQPARRHAREGPPAEVEEELRAALVGLDLLDGEDGLEARTVGHADEAADGGLLGHLQHQVAAEPGGVLQDGGERRAHEVVERARGVVRGVDATPRRTDDHRIGGEGLHFQEVLVEQHEGRGALAVEPQVVLQHLQLARVDVIGHVVLEVGGEVDRDAADAAEGLEDADDSCGGEAGEEVVRDGLGDDRVPALLVDADALVEAREEEAPLLEVAVEPGRDPVLLLQPLAPAVVVLEVETARLHLEVPAQPRPVVVLPQHLLQRVVVDARQRFLHQIIQQPGGRQWALALDRVW